MRKLVLAWMFSALAWSTAMAQPVAEQMTCQQARDYFATYGVIYKSVHGQVLPIRRGVPIGVNIACTGPYSFRFTYSTRTLDNPRCVSPHYCS